MISLIFVYIKVVISTSQLLHINYFMTFPFVTSYFGSVTLEIILKSRGLTIAEVSFMDITSHCCLTMTGFQGMVGFDISDGVIRRAGMVEHHP